MKRIAYISSNEVAPWGGSEELWYQSARQMKKEGHQVSVNVKYWPVTPKPVLELQQLGCQIYFRKGTMNPQPLARISRKFKSLLSRRPSRFFLPLHSWLRETAPQLVVISLEMNTSGFPLMKACQDLEIPYVLIIESAGEAFWPGEKAAQNLISGYNQALRCFFVSHGNWQLTEKQLAFSLRNAAIVRNPFKVSYHASPAWPSETTWRLACVGRLDLFAKGQDLIFEVLRTEKWRHRNIAVTLYGDGKQQVSLERLKEMWSLSNIKIGGFEEHVEGIWAENHALLLPSRFEGLPLAVVEAMLCGRICIVTNVAGNAELLTDDETGFVAAAPTAALLDEAMERAWNRRAEWREMGVKANLILKKHISENPVFEFNNELIVLVQKLQPLN